MNNDVTEKSDLDTLQPKLSFSMNSPWSQTFCLCQMWSFCVVGMTTSQLQAALMAQPGLMCGLLSHRCRHVHFWAPAFEGLQAEEGSLPCAEGTGGGHPQWQHFTTFYTCLTYKKRTTGM